MVAGMSRRHRPAMLIADHAGEQADIAPSAAGERDIGPVRELSLHCLEQVAIDNRLMLAWVDFAVVNHLADVGAIGEQVVEGPAAERTTTPDIAFAAHHPLARHTGADEAPAQFGDVRRVKVLAHDPPYRLGLFGHRHQLLVGDGVAQGQGAAHPHTLGARGRNLVPDPLGRDLALELGEREQDVEGQPAHRGGRTPG